MLTPVRKQTMIKKLSGGINSALPTHVAKSTIQLLRFVEDLDDGKPPSVFELPLYNAGTGWTGMILGRRSTIIKAVDKKDGPAWPKHRCYFGPELFKPFGWHM